MQTQRKLELTTKWLELRQQRKQQTVNKRSDSKQCEYDKGDNGIRVKKSFAK